MSRELLNSLNKSTNYEFRAQKITSYSLWVDNSLFEDYACANAWHVLVSFEKAFVEFQMTFL